MRPTFVKPGPSPGFPNVATRYLGTMLRLPLPGETQPAINPPLPPGYRVGIELPPLNMPVLGTGANANTGGGIERFRDNIGRGRMPADRPTLDIITAQEEVVRNAEESLRLAEEILEDDSTNPALLADVEMAEQNLDRERHQLHVYNSGARPLSNPPFNENAWFSNDYWVLHSTWTSFDECKNYVRMLIDILGFDNIMVSNWIGLSLELLPNR